MTSLTNTDEQRLYLVASKAAYEAHPKETSFPEAKTPKERVEIFLSQPEVVKCMGTGWKYIDIKNPLDYVVLQNDQLRQLIFVARGSVELKKDFVEADFMGYLFGNEKRFKEAEEHAKFADALAKKLGYELVFAGHSLGGLLAEFTGVIFNRKYWAFNAPEFTQNLVFGEKVNNIIKKFIIERKSFDKGNNVKLEGDLVSEIFDRGGESFNKRGGLVLKNNENLPAHKLDSLIYAATDGEWDGSFGNKNSKGKKSNISKKLSENKSYDVGLTYHLTLLSEYGRIYAVEEYDINIFFSQKNTNVKVINKKGEVIDEYTKESLGLSSYMKNAVSDFSSNVCIEALNNLLSSKSGRTAVGKIFEKCSKIAAENFLESLIVDKIVPEDFQFLGSLAASSTVKLILNGGDLKSVSKELVNNILSNALTELAGIPIGAGSKKLVTNSKLFGNKEISKTVKRDSVTVGTLNTGIGVHSHKTVSIYKDKFGIPIEKVGRGFGAHGTVFGGVVDISVGFFQGGTEKGHHSIKSQGFDITIEHTRKFNFEINIDLKVGNRGFNLHLPAFRDRVYQKYVKQPENGSIMEHRKSDVVSKEFSSRAKEVLKDIQTPSVGHSNKSHDKIALEMYNQMKQNDGHNEYVLAEQGTKDKLRDYFNLKHKSITEVHDIGILLEQETIIHHAKQDPENSNLITSTINQYSEKSVFDDTRAVIEVKKHLFKKKKYVTEFAPGKRRQTVPESNVSTKISITSTKDGTPINKREKTEKTNLDGIEATLERREADMHLVNKKTVEVKHHDGEKITESEIMIGESEQIITSDPVNQEFLNENNIEMQRTTQKIVTERGTYVDTLKNSDFPSNQLPKREENKHFEQIEIRETESRKDNKFIESIPLDNNEFFGFKGDTAANVFQNHKNMKTIKNYHLQIPTEKVDREIEQLRNKEYKTNITEEFSSAIITNNKELSNQSSNGLFGDVSVNVRKSDSLQGIGQMEYLTRNTTQEEDGKVEVQTYKPGENVLLFRESSLTRIQQTEYESEIKNIPLQKRILPNKEPEKQTIRYDATITDQTIWVQEATQPQVSESGSEFKNSPLLEEQKPSIPPTDQRRVLQGIQVDLIQYQPENYAKGILVDSVYKSITEKSAYEEHQTIVSFDDNPKNIQTVFREDKNLQQLETKEEVVKVSRGLLLDEVTKTTKTMDASGGKISETSSSETQLNVPTDHVLGRIGSTLGVMMTDMYYNNSRTPNISWKKELIELGETYMLGHAKVLASNSFVPRGVTLAVSTVCASNYLKSRVDKNSSQNMGRNITNIATVAKTCLPQNLSLAVDSIDFIVQIGTDKELSKKNVKEKIISKAAPILSSIATSYLGKLLLDMGNKIVRKGILYQGITTIVIGILSGVVVSSISHYIEKRNMWNKYLELCNQYGLDPNCNENTVRTTYRSHSLKLHPDKGGSNEKFIELLEDFDKIEEYRNYFEINKSKESKGQISWSTYFRNILRAILNAFKTDNNPELKNLDVCLALIEEEQYKQWKNNLNK